MEQGNKQIYSVERQGNRCPNGMSLYSVCIHVLLRSVKPKLDFTLSSSLLSHFFPFQNGLIRTKADDYIIEPIKDATIHGPSGFVGQPHKLYKRAVLDTRDQDFFEAQKTGKSSFNL